MNGTVIFEGESEVLSPRQTDHLLIARGYSLFGCAFLIADLTRAEHDLRRPLRAGWLMSNSSTTVFALRRLSLLLCHVI